MKKKLSFLLAFIFTFAITLSGCNLFALDSVKYANQKVASIDYEDGTTITITKEELVRAYNNYGSQLSSYSKEEAINYLLDYLFKKEIILKEVDDNKNLFPITNADLNDVFETTLNSVLSGLSDFEDQVIEDWNLNTPSELNTETETEPTTFKEYEKKAYTTFENGNWVIKVFEDEDVVEDLNYTAGKQIETIIASVNDKIGNNDVLKEAYKRYIKSLKEYEKGQNLSTVENEIFQREVERIYDNVLDNKKLSIYSEKYSEHNGYSTITINQVFNYIQNNMLASYLEYSTNQNNFNDDMLSSRSDAWYIMNNEYFYVTHILVKYTDEQTNAISELKTAKEQGKISEKAYIDGKQQIFNNLIVKSYGENTSLTVEQLLSNLQTALDGKSVEDKIDVINQYVYEYNEDTGNKNATFEYVIGLNDSKMVESFTDASRELFDNGNGTFGDISGIVESEYGAHIVIYLNPVENAFTITNPNTFSLLTTDTNELEQNINTINNYKLSILNTETLFDYVYEKLESDNFSKFEGLQLSVLKQQNGIKTYTFSSVYQDMLK